MASCTAVALNNRRPRANTTEEIAEVVILFNINCSLTFTYFVGHDNKRSRASTNEQIDEVVILLNIDFNSMFTYIIGQDNERYGANTVEQIEEVIVMSVKLLTLLKLLKYPLLDRIQMLIPFFDMLNQKLLKKRKQNFVQYESII